MRSPAHRAWPAPMWDWYPSDASAQGLRHWRRSCLRRRAGLARVCMELCLQPLRRWHGGGLLSCGGEAVDSRIGARSGVDVCDGRGYARVRCRQSSTLLGAGLALHCVHTCQRMTRPVLRY